MTDAPRTLLNRLLYLAIAIMTPAIFVVLGLIVWLLIRDDPVSQEDANLKVFSIPGASISYQLPEGCIDMPEIDADSIHITFEGVACQDLKNVTREGAATWSLSQ